MKIFNNITFIVVILCSLYSLSEEQIKSLAPIKIFKPKRVIVGSRELTPIEITINYQTFIDKTIFQTNEPVRIEIAAFIGNDILNSNFTLMGETILLFKKISAYMTIDFPDNIKNKIIKKN